MVTRTQNARGFFLRGCGGDLQADLVELHLLCQKHKMLANFFMCACLAFPGARFIVYIYMSEAQNAREFFHVHGFRIFESPICCV